MKALLLPLALLLLLVPTAAAAGKPRPDEGRVTVGPCEAGWAFMLDNWGQDASCTVGRTELFHVSEYSTFWGHHCVYRVGGHTVRECDPRW